MISIARCCLLVVLWFPIQGGWLLAQSEPTTAHWPQWRGPAGTGVSSVATPPTRWSETENVRWKTPVPGLGHSTPVVWDQTIFLTTAIPTGQPFEPIPDRAPGSHDNLPVSRQFSFNVLAVDRNDGRVLWNRAVHKAVPHAGGHVSASLASASPVTDGERVYVSFGSYGIYCLDFEGQLIWERSLGTMQTKHGHGEGASPTLHDQTLVVNWDHEGQSFLIAMEKETGKTIWRRNRGEVTSWSSPIVSVVDGRPQVIVAGTAAVRGYDLETGETIWSCRGLSNNICATPVEQEGVLYVGSSYEIRAMFALKLSGSRGDITGTDQVLWRRSNRTPYVPTPLLYRDKLYYLRHYQAILSVAEVNTGDDASGPFRIPGLRDLYASPVAANGRIYLTDRDGVTVVLSEPDLPRILSINQLDDSFSASIALADSDLLLRGEKSLYCLSERADAEQP